MVDLKQFRREWSADLKRLRNWIKGRGSLADIKALFFRLHGVLHSQSLSGLDEWSYADEIFSDLETAEYRVIPSGTEHSLMWILWHISRIEDITMNILIGGDEQVYLQEVWKENLHSPIDYTGNQITWDDLISLSNTLDPAKLQQYREAVGRRTRDVVGQLTAERFFDGVLAQDLERIVHEGAVLAESEELLAYWGKKKIYQLLLMPPTRHLMVHLNEAWNLKKLIRKG